MNEWDELGRALAELTASGVVEVREDGQWLAGFAALHCELRGTGKNLLVHLWSNERTLTRRIVGVRERSPDRVVFDVQRFGHTKPGRLEFLRTDSPRPVGRVSREQFRDRFRRSLAENFPDSTVDSLTTSPDLEHSFSGVYVRGRMHEGTREHAIIGVSQNENAAVVEGILTFGVLWLDWVRQHTQSRAIEGLRVFVPDSTSRFIRERALGLDRTVRLEIFEFNEREGRVRKTDPADVGNLESRLIPKTENESCLEAAAEALGRVRVLAAIDSDLSNTIAARVVAGTNEVAFCFRGLEFARWSQGGTTFGSNVSCERLTESRRPRLRRLMQQLDIHRRSPAQVLNHPLYRAAPERWLETVLSEDPSRIDARLDPRYLYSEVPALAGGDRGVLDLLGVTLRGRLVVIELKASEDIQMPMQAVDYWLRVRRHQQAGDFQRAGYFPGLEISAQPPMVWLIAPGLRFHPATDTLLKYLLPEISVTRIGVNENWRAELKIVFRQ